ncbi:CPBP family intramembrane metalloprotease [Candidatus Roizmanbacteria bacterium]|nr:CPBP family intramembrane metalloprotease [Candidatus Roizmanbacteria bacterium]
MNKTNKKFISGSSILATLGLWILLSVIVGVSSWLLVDTVQEWKKANIPILLVVAECYALLPIVIFFVYGGIHGLRDRLNLRYTSIRDLVLAIGLFAAIVVCSLLLYLSFGLATGSLWGTILAVIRDVTDMSRFSTANTLAWGLILVRVFLLAGLAEELFFRGMLFGWLRQRFSARMTILITALLFTVEHYYLILFPVAFIFGLAVGWLRERTGSILPGLIVHILTDGLLLLIAYILTQYHVAG